MASSLLTTDKRFDTTPVPPSPLARAMRLPNSPSSFPIPFAILDRMRSTARALPRALIPVTPADSLFRKKNYQFFFPCHVWRI
jgi:hypothetical protein